LALLNAHADAEAEKRLDAIEADGLMARAEAALAADFATLRPRILKERALGLSGNAHRQAAAAAAADGYQRAFETHGGAYPAINAASLWALSGDVGKARKMAALACDLAATQPPYWALASTAEARLVLGDPAGAAQAYAAAALADGRHEQLASTRRQARWLAAALGVDLDPDAALPAPSVLHWVAEPGLQRIAAGLAPGFASPRRARASPH